MVVMIYGDINGYFNLRLVGYLEWTNNNDNLIIVQQDKEWQLMMVTSVKGNQRTNYIKLKWSTRIIFNAKTLHLESLYVYIINYYGSKYLVT